MKKNKPASSPSTTGANGGLNRRARRQLERTKKKRTRLISDPSKIVTKDKVIYKDNSYIDKTKRLFTSGLQAVKDRLARKKQTFDLPEQVNMVRKPLRTTVLVLNKDGRSRTILPDIPGCHKILCHGSIAKVMVSGVCMLVRVQASEDAHGVFIDGSWAITPADYRLINETTIQHVRRRRWWFLHRYWYEISFDGHVQPANLFFDYNMEVLSHKQRFWITREYVPVRKNNSTVVGGTPVRVYNDYFRFWRFKPNKTTASRLSTTGQKD